MDLFPWVSRPSSFSPPLSSLACRSVRKLAPLSSKKGEMLANFQIRVFAPPEPRAHEEMHGWS